jgi:stage II sporulation protein P
MSKRFKNHKLKRLIIFFLIVFSLTICFCCLFHRLYKKIISTDQSLVVSLLLKDNLGNFNLNNLKILKDPTFLVKYNLEQNLNLLPQKEEISTSKITDSNYLVYIYNTHQGEEYSNVGFEEFNITPTVETGSYILKEYLKEYNINSYVEEQSIKEILNTNNWKYGSSYRASRLLLTEAKNKYSTLNYFIDIHRDSGLKNVTTTTFNNQNYARLLFIIGLENKNYLQNENLANKINDEVKAINPNLTRGILEKQGLGVNGVYNQDFNSNTILIEVGGEYNSLEEVNNTMKILANVLNKVINNE